MDNKKLTAVEILFNHHQKLEKRERHLNNLKNLHGKYINRTKLIKSVNKELYGYYGISALDK
tara:strand:- start:244 stop:429 length:186 start_codon:yes stop_codon:yes gene_type:complete